MMKDNALSRKLNNNGFTLTEIIVVMVITEFLMAMVISIFISSYNTLGSAKDRFGDYNEVIMIENYVKNFVNNVNENSYQVTYEKTDEFVSYQVIVDEHTVLELKYDSNTLSYSKNSDLIEYTYSDTLFTITYDSELKILNLEFYKMKDEVKEVERNYYYNLLIGVTNYE